MHFSSHHAPPDGGDGLSVRFLGVRGSIPSPETENSGYGGNTSCVEVRGGGQIIILDAGSGLRRLGRELVAEAGSASLQATLLISHTHWDHIQGLPFFSAAYAPTNRIRILGAPGTAERLLAALHFQMSPAHFPVGLSQQSGLLPVGELESADTFVGPVRVRTIPLNHPGGCTGFRLSFAGVSVAYLPDHEPYRSAWSGVPDIDHDGRLAAAESALINFVEDVDWLIIDSQYDRDEYPSRVGWGHGCLDDCLDLAFKANVRNLALFHHDPDHDDVKIDAMVARARHLIEARGSSLTVCAAKEQERLEVRRKRRLAA